MIDIVKLLKENKEVTDFKVNSVCTESYENFDADYLFEALGMEKNEEKLRYYIRMDELF